MFEKLFVPVISIRNSMFEKLFVPVIIKNYFSLENLLFSEKRNFFFWKVCEIYFERKKLVILGKCKNFLGKISFGVDLGDCAR